MCKQSSIKEECLIGREQSIISQSAPFELTCLNDDGVNGTHSDESDSMHNYAELELEQDPLPISNSEPILDQINSTSSSDSFDRIIVSGLNSVNENGELHAIRDTSNIDTSNIDTQLPMQLIDNQRTSNEVLNVVNSITIHEELVLPATENFTVIGEYNSGSEVDDADDEGYIEVEHEFTRDEELESSVSYESSEADELNDSSILRANSRQQLLQDEEYSDEDSISDLISPDFIEFPLSSKIADATDTSQCLNNNDNLSVTNDGNHLLTTSINSITQTELKHSIIPFNKDVGQDILLGTLTESSNQSKYTQSVNSNTNNSELLNTLISFSKDLTEESKPDKNNLLHFTEKNVRDYQNDFSLGKNIRDYQNEFSLGKKYNENNYFDGKMECTEFFGRLGKNITNSDSKPVKAEVTCETLDQSSQFTSSNGLKLNQSASVGSSCVPSDFELNVSDSIKSNVLVNPVGNQSKNADIPSQTDGIISEKTGHGGARLQDNIGKLAEASQATWDSDNITEKQVVAANYINKKSKSNKTKYNNQQISESKSEIENQIAEKVSNTLRNQASQKGNVTAHELVDNHNNIFNLIQEFPPFTTASSTVTKEDNLSTSVSSALVSSEFQNCKPANYTKKSVHVPESVGNLLELDSSTFTSVEASSAQSVSSTTTSGSQRPDLSSTMEANSSVERLSTLGRRSSEGRRSTRSRKSRTRPAIESSLLTDAVDYPVQSSSLKDNPPPLPPRQNNPRRIVYSEADPTAKLVTDGVSTPPSPQSVSSGGAKPRSKASVESRTAENTSENTRMRQPNLSREQSVRESIRLIPTPKLMNRLTSTSGRTPAERSTSKPASTNEDRLPRSMLKITFFN